LEIGFCQTFCILIHKHGHFKTQNTSDIQGDQIGRNYAIWVIFYGVGQIFFYKKLPNDLGEILAMKK
jgi:hypothetical protein